MTMFKSLGAYQVDEILYAGEKPYSLFDQDLVIHELKAHGINTIVNLMEEHEFNRYDSNSLNAEFEVLSFPIVDNSVTDLETIARILSHIKNDSITYVHCNLGLGRTGIIVASYLHKIHGYQSSDILQKISELKENSTLSSKASPITKEQVDFVKTQLVHM